MDPCSPKRCSKASAVTRSWQSFTAHEFFETITDRTGPSAWVGVAGEIGDACTGYQACVPLSNAQTFQIQAEYSNAANASVIR